MRSVLGVLLCAGACACAKAPDASTPPKASTETSAPASVDAGVSGDASARFPGLPMPQQYPRLVWDAAAADAAR
jgi:hypothetical protein